MAELASSIDSPQTAHEDIAGASLADKGSGLRVDDVAHEALLV
jgi:hypothetical protein